MKKYILIRSKHPFDIYTFYPETLKEAKENYKKYRVCKKDFLEYVREAFKEENR